MGEIADMMLDGTLCERCGVCLVDEDTEPNGYPTLCASCAAEKAEDDAADRRSDEGKEQARGEDA